MMTARATKQERSIRTTYCERRLAIVDLDTGDHEQDQISLGSPVPEVADNAEEYLVSSTRLESQTHTAMFLGRASAVTWTALGMIGIDHPGLVDLDFQCRRSKLCLYAMYVSTTR